MKPKPNELPDNLIKSVQAGVSGLDIIHGELKNWMYETEQELNPLLQQSEEIGSDEDYSDTEDRLWLSGYMEALADVYNLTYQLSFAIMDKEKEQE
jgi:hypothetical protein